VRAPPHQRRAPPEFAGTAEQLAVVDAEVQRLLSLGAIEASSEVSLLIKVFPVPKSPAPDGTPRWRLISDFRPANEAIAAQPFRVEDLRDTRLLLRPGWAMASIDLTDMFLSIPLHPSATRLSGFRHRGVTYRFRACPFGVRCAPFAATRMLRPALDLLRREGLVIQAYLDDLLLMAPTVTEVEAAAARTVEVLEDLGWVVNRTKSVLSGSTRLTYLGHELDSRTMEVRATAERRRAFRADVTALLRNARRGRAPSLRQLASTLGKLSALAPSMRTTWLHLRPLISCRDRLLRLAHRDWRSLVPLPLPADLEAGLQWWRRRLRHPMRAPLKPPPPRKRLTTDASTKGWGATLETRVGRRWVPVGTAAGRWTPAEAERHVNHLELHAVELGLAALCGDLPRGTGLALRSDNTVTVAYVAKQGGRTPQLAERAQAVWARLLARDLFPHVSHVRGVHNTAADQLSRLPPSWEWAVKPSVVAALEQRWRVRHTLDAFASAWNAQTPRYWSAMADPAAVETDALLQPWGASGEALWVCPPFALVPRVLDKVLTEQATVSLVVPAWTNRPWWALLVRMAVTPPLDLSELDPEPLWMPLEGALPPPFRMVALRVSGHPGVRGAAARSASTA
jgi:hypothetical protein